MSVNKQIIVGNLGADPDVRHTSGGKQVTELRVATSYGAGDNKVTEWFRVVAWEKLADAAAKYLKKGSKVYIEGRTQTRSYEHEGAKKYITEVIATDIRFLDAAPADDPDQGGEAPKTKRVANKTRSTAPADDDIPF